MFSLVIEPSPHIEPINPLVIRSPPQYVCLCGSKQRFIVGLLTILFGCQCSAHV
uniref:Uncharacterized protein n=1 Tax=Arion vulgaris TaxID=1028688 RepID=A0A0B7BGF9_9EUPU